MTRPPTSSETVHERIRIAKRRDAGRAVPLAADEARADGDVGVPERTGPASDERTARVVLAVAVDAQREVEAVLVRVAVSRSGRRRRSRG